VAADSRVVVVGGGLAGCACALGLAGRGVEVTLLEAGSTLGGRVQSVNLKGMERGIDNSQHAAFRVYGRFLQLLATCDAREIIKLQKRTTLVSTIHNTLHFASTAGSCNCSPPAMRVK